MGKVIKIGISENSGEEIIEKESVEAIAGKGLSNDRFFKDSNHPRSQLTIIESENIDKFNKLLDKPISYIKFRRNIVTKGILLNNLINKIISIGSVTVKVHDLCEPCKHLQDMLGKNNLVKNLVHKSGIRCEILSSGIIKTNDEINAKL